MNQNNNLPGDIYIDKSLEDNVTSTYNSNIKSEYESFQKIIKSYVDASCYAMTENDNIIFNTYPDVSVRDKLIEENIRSSIIENPQTLLYEMFDKYEDFKLEIYMFPSKSSYKIIIDYDNDSGFFYVSKKVSH